MYLKLNNQNANDYHYALIAISTHVYELSSIEEQSNQAVAKYDKGNDVVLLKNTTGNCPEYITLYEKNDKENLPFVYGIFKLDENGKHQSDLQTYKRIPILR